MPHWKIKSCWCFPQKSSPEIAASFPSSQQGIRIEETEAADVKVAFQLFCQWNISSFVLFPIWLLKSCIRDQYNILFDRHKKSGIFRCPALKTFSTTTASAVTWGIHLETISSNWRSIRTASEPTRARFGLFAKFISDLDLADADPDPQPGVHHIPLDVHGFPDVPSLRSQVLS